MMTKVSIKKVINMALRNTNMVDGLRIDFEQSADSYDKVAKAKLSDYVVEEVAQGVYLVGGTQFKEANRGYARFVVTSSEPMYITGEGEIKEDAVAHRVDHIDVYLGNANLKLQKDTFNGIGYTTFHITNRETVFLCKDLSGMMCEGYDTGIEIGGIEWYNSINADGAFEHCGSVCAVKINNCHLQGLSLNDCFRNNHEDGIGLIEVEASEIDIDECKNIFSDANIYDVVIKNSKIDVKCDSRYLADNASNGQIGTLDISNSIIKLSTDCDFDHIKTDYPLYVEMIVANDTTIWNFEAFKNMLKYMNIQEVVTNVPEIQKAVDEAKREIMSEFHCSSEDAAQTFIGYENTGYSRFVY